MKVLKALLAALIVSFTGNAQIVALNSTAEGGFELGTSFSANGWVEVTPPTNRWIVSTTTPYAGTRVAFVSNGTANTYTFTTAQTCHIYKDVTIPSSSVAITLSFYWRSSGQIGTDRLLVYTAPVSVTPVVNVPAAPATVLAPSATLVWTQTATSAGYTLATVTLPSSLSGTTFRLIFTWQNDAATGANPPAAVDNISVTYNCAYPNPIAGVTTVCEGGTSVLGSASPGGTWVSSNPAVATVSASGNVTANVQGTTTISYTTGCANPATTVVTVIAAPSPISGPSGVCAGSSITLTDTAWGGGWTSSAPSYASINSITGVVNGLVPGVATMTYANGCGSPVTKTITVNPIPAAITGGDTVCEGGGTLTLSSASAGGTWSSLSTANATVGSSSGIVTGVSDGTVSIVYTNSFGCFVSKMVTVSALPAPITGIAPFCVGSNITLASTFPGGTWNSAMPGIAMISASGVVTGLTAGFTTISYSNGCGPTTAIVSVDALPASITGFDTVCVGGTTTFANSVLGGTWSSGDPTKASVLPTSGIITGVASGVAVIYYTMPGGCQISRVVHIEDVPGPITGPTDVCPGNTITLSNGTPGGTWTSYAPGSATISATTGTLTGINPDIVSIGYTTPAGCVAYTSVTVNPVPSPIIGGVKYCATDVDTLFNASAGGTWTSVTPGVASIGNTTGIMTTLAGGTAVIRYTLTATGCSTTKSFTVNPLPVPAIGFVWATNTFETGTWYVSYQWYHSVFGKLPGATLYKVAGTFNGNYTVEVTDTNGCMNMSSPAPYATWMGVGSVQGQTLYSVFPNPATDVLFIDADQTVNAVISSLDGKALIEAQNAQKIDVASLPSGLYMLTLYNKDGVKVAVEKFTKQ